jgi:predicted PolB exonuclease-like 3'-5' exonuclease
MLIALDIETIGNPKAVELMPVPEVKTGNLRDPDKIAAKVEEAITDRNKKAALDPLTARIAAYSAVGGSGPNSKAAEFVEVLECDSDEAEVDLVESALSMLSADQMRIITWNGKMFDLPMLYKRALILGVDTAKYNAPPLSAWIGKQSSERHYDLMQLWCGYRDMLKLSTIASVVLKKSKDDLDVASIPELLKTAEGKKNIQDYCLTDSRLTWELFQRMNGYLFA